MTKIKVSLMVTVFCVSLMACSGQTVRMPGPRDAPASVSKAVGMPAHMPATSPGYAGRFGFGRPATAEEIAAWDNDVRPDGTGLPAGSGTVSEGAIIYAVNCARCHGATGTEGPYNALVGPMDPNAPWPQSPPTIGNYWPYATSLYDWIQRAMPFDAPGSLSPDQVYSVVAWLLHQNELIAEDDVMDANSLRRVEMPALERFVPYDPRDTYPFR